MTRAHTRVVIAALAAATVIKLILAATTYGTNDVLYWEEFLRIARAEGGIGLYRTVPIFNHPPFMIHVLRVVGWIADVTGIAFPFLVRLPSIVADVFSVRFVSRLARGDTARWPALAVVALSPVSIMISGFHGNSDPVMICLVLYSLYLLQQNRMPAAGLAFGLAMNVKIVPVIFAPVVLLWLPDWRSRIKFATRAAIVALAGSLPYVVQDPGVILKNVAGYTSIYGHWGLSRLLQSAAPSSPLNGVYRTIGGVLVIGILAAVASVARRRGASAFFAGGVTAFGFLALAPGFGVQYLAWIVPWTAAFGTAAGVVFQVTSGLFLYLVYTFWSGGLPWDNADSLTAGDWQGHIVYFEIVAWSAIAGIWGTRLVRIIRPPNLSGAE